MHTLKAIFSSFVSLLSSVPPEPGPEKTANAVQLYPTALTESHPGHCDLHDPGLVAVATALEQCAQARLIYARESRTALKFEPVSEKSALALSSYIRVLASKEKKLGSDHPDVDESLHNLGRLFFDKASYSRAEPVFKRSLAIRERVLGPSHLGVAESLHYLGKLYLIQGLFSMAEPLFQRSLAIREQILGPVHADVADSLGKLAAVFAATGRYDQATLLYSRSLAIYEKSIDLNRPLWEKTSENLALLRRFLG